MQTFVSLNYILRVGFSLLMLTFCIALPLRLDASFQAPWWLIFLPLYAILALWAVFVLDSYRKFRKSKGLDFKVKAFNLFYHLVYLASMISLSIWFTYLTEKLDESADRTWAEVFAPLAIVSGVVFVSALIMFLISTLDFGSVQPISERFQSALVSRVGYILILSCAAFVFSLVLTAKLEDSISLSFWNVFGVFWFLFALFVVIFFLCITRVCKKRSKKTKAAKQEDEEVPPELADDTATGAAANRKRRKCLVMTVVIWFPLFLFAFLLCARLELWITWKWINVFAPILFIFSLVSVWCMSNGGRRILYDILEED
jgi:cytochrome bd-type quinol oxidase subunit 2